jgi:hypothetical protein
MHFLMGVSLFLVAAVESALAMLVSLFLVAAVEELYLLRIIW